jgi:hypothetical protein
MKSSPAWCYFPIIGTNSIIVIVGKDTISFMQGIYTYIPKTNHDPKQYNVAAILSLLFVVPISLAPALALMYFYISTFRSMCAVPNMAVYCSSLTSCFPGIIIIIIIIIIFSGSAAQRGLWPPRLRGFVITHNEAPQSVGLL